MTENMFSESDFKMLDLRSCDKSSVSSFLATINGETLGKKVLTAIGLKEQGRFDRAMLYISEANRDQVIAVREVQGILDKLENRDKKEVIFEKFRQTLPLQIGLSNGQDVLALLKGLEDKFEGALLENTGELNQAEEELENWHDELIFLQERMSGRISPEELDDSKDKVSQASARVRLLKTRIISYLAEYTTERYSALAAGDRISLISNVYLIVTSKIETRDSKSVSV